MRAEAGEPSGMGEGATGARFPLISAPTASPVDMAILCPGLRAGGLRRLRAMKAAPKLTMVGLWRRSQTSVNHVALTKGEPRGGGDDAAGALLVFENLIAGLVRNLTHVAVVPQLHAAFFDVHTT